MQLIQAYSCHHALIAGSENYIISFVNIPPSNWLVSYYCLVENIQQLFVVLQMQTIMLLWNIFTATFIFSDLLGLILILNKIALVENI